MECSFSASLNESHPWNAALFYPFRHSCHTTKCMLRNMARNGDQHAGNALYRNSLASSASRRREDAGTCKIDKVLVAGEFVCIMTSVASSASLMYQTFRPEVRHDTMLPIVNSAKFTRLLSWQVLPLCLALIINGILRVRFWPHISGNERINTVADQSLTQRLEKMEDELGSTISIVRGLSRQLEKLGVRFQVTRRTLRDPIAETAMLAQKTSEAVHILAVREKMFANELREIQDCLMAIQEQQSKQLAIIVKLLERISNPSNKQEKVQ